MLDEAVYRERRKRVLERMGDADAAIFFSPDEKIRSRDSTYRYRADSDVVYLTGFEEPQAVVVLRSGAEEALTLFVRKRDENMEIWNGRRAGTQGAVERYGADQAFTLEELSSQLPALLEDAETIHYHLGQAFDKTVLDAVSKVCNRRGKAPARPKAYRSSRDLVHPVRLIKEGAELDALRATCALTAEAHLAAMKACKPGMYEYELQALIEYVFMVGGASAPAYGSIVGAGANATVLHYTENRSQIGADDLVLIDAGSELDHYAGDITRTFPASGTFSPVQKDVYQAVLAAENAAIKRCVVGATWLEIHEATVLCLTQSMVDLGLLSGDVDNLVESEAYKRFYMHKTGHWLGIDVHDVGPYYEDGAPKKLEVGVVQTVEPGLYIQPGTEGVDERFWGIGVRIEDDVLTTAEGPAVLTADCPKTVAEIEALVGSGYFIDL
jgi:Xaa-Pro aminopeptidase